MRISLSIFLLLTLAGSLRAQSPHDDRAAAHTLLDLLPRGAWYQQYKFEAQRRNALHMPELALLYYERAFSFGPAALNDLLEASALALRTDSQGLARVFLRRAFLEGMSDDVLSALLERTGSNIREQANWPDADSIRSWQGQYRSRLDTVLLRRLQVLEREDQRFRADDAYDERGAQLSDSLNAEALRAIVRELGRLPGNSDVGYQGLDVLELLFVHMNHEHLGWFLPYILAQVEAGEYFDVDGLAYQIDRIAVSSGLALYIDEKNRLVYDTIMPVFAARQYYSVTGYWYEALPPDGQQYAWPVFEPFMATRMPLTRRRLHLDSYEAFQQRRPWVLPIRAAALKEKLGG